MFDRSTGKFIERLIIPLLLVACVECVEVFDNATRTSDQPRTTPTPMTNETWQQLLQQIRLQNLGNIQTSNAEDRYVYSAVAVNTLCEHDSIEINCLPSHFVNILSAFYGRQDQQTCYDPWGWIKPQTCGSLYDSTQTARNICQWRRRCVIDSTSATFGDPCAPPADFVIKYLNVKYQCIGTRELQVCEGQTATMICQGTTRIRVSSAFYGRRSQFICSLPYYTAVSNVNCGLTAQNLATVKDLCDGKVRCSFLVGNQQFHDPCPGTFKYMEVTWECI